MLTQNQIKAMRDWYHSRYTMLYKWRGPYEQHTAYIMWRVKWHEFIRKHDPC